MESASGEWTLFNYQLGLFYKPAKNGSVYLSYATASTPPSITGGDQEGLSANINDLEPEKSRTIELGTKWNVLNERLNLTPALFQTERHDAQIEVAPEVARKIVWEGQSVSVRVDMGGRRHKK